MAKLFDETKHRRGKGGKFRWQGFLQALTEQAKTTDPSKKEGLELPDGVGIQAGTKKVGTGVTKRTYEVRSQNGAKLHETYDNPGDAAKHAARISSSVESPTEGTPGEKPGPNSGTKAYSEGDHRRLTEDVARAATIKAGFDKRVASIQADGKTPGPDILRNRKRAHANHAAAQRQLTGFQQRHGVAPLKDQGVPGKNPQTRGSGDRTRLVGTPEQERARGERNSRMQNAVGQSKEQRDANYEKMHGKKPDTDSDGINWGKPPESDGVKNYTNTVDPRNGWLTGKESYQLSQLKSRARSAKGPGAAQSARKGIEQMEALQEKRTAEAKRRGLAGPDGKPVAGGKSKPAGGTSSKTVGDLPVGAKTAGGGEIVKHHPATGNRPAEVSIRNNRGEVERVDAKEKRNVAPQRVGGSGSGDLKNPKADGGHAALSSHTAKLDGHDRAKKALADHAANGRKVHDDLATALDSIARDRRNRGRKMKNSGGDATVAESYKRDADALLAAKKALGGSGGGSTGGSRSEGASSSSSGGTTPPATDGTGAPTPASLRALKPGESVKLPDGNTIKRVSSMSYSINGSSETHFGADKTIANLPTGGAPAGPRELTDRDYRQMGDGDTIESPAGHKVTASPKDKAGIRTYVIEHPNGARTRAYGATKAKDAVSSASPVQPNGGSRVAKNITDFLADMEPRSDAALDAATTRQLQDMEEKYRGTTDPADADWLRRIQAKLSGPGYTDTGLNTTAGSPWDADRDSGFQSAQRGAVPRNDSDILAEAQDGDLHPDQIDQSAAEAKDPSVKAQLEDLAYDRRLEAVLAQNPGFYQMDTWTRDNIAQRAGLPQDPRIRRSNEKKRAVTEAGQARIRADVSKNLAKIEKASGLDPDTYALADEIIGDKDPDLIDAISKGKLTKEQAHKAARMVGTANNRIQAPEDRARAKDLEARLYAQLKQGGTPENPKFVKMPHELMDSGSRYKKLKVAYAVVVDGKKVGEYHKIANYREVGNRSYSQGLVKDGSDLWEYFEGGGQYTKWHTGGMQSPEGSMQAYDVEQAKSNARRFLKYRAEKARAEATPAPGTELPGLAKLNEDRSMGRISDAQYSERVQALRDGSPGAGGGAAPSNFGTGETVYVEGLAYKVDRTMPDGRINLTRNNRYAQVMPGDLHRSKQASIDAAEARASEPQEGRASLAALKRLTTGQSLRTPSGVTIKRSGQQSWEVDGVKHVGSGTAMQAVLRKEQQSGATADWRNETPEASAARRGNGTSVPPADGDTPMAVSHTNRLIDDVENGTTTNPAIHVMIAAEINQARERGKLTPETADALMDRLKQATSYGSAEGNG